MQPGLFGPSLSAVGILGLFNGESQPSVPEFPWLAPPISAMLSGTVVPMGSIIMAARLFRGAFGGAILRPDGRTEPFPGLVVDPLLATDSPALAEARQRITEGAIHITYVWPIGGDHAPGGRSP